jgi:hypothetical protein
MIEASAVGFLREQNAKIADSQSRRIKQNSNFFWIPGWTAVLTRGARPPQADTSGEPRKKDASKNLIARVAIR